jgi:hypothetical protein
MVFARTDNPSDDILVEITLVKNLKFEKLGIGIMGLSATAKVWELLDKVNGQIETDKLCEAFPTFKRNTCIQAFARWNKKHKLIPEQVIPAEAKEITIDLMEQIVLAELKTATGKIKQDYVRYAMDLLKYKQPVAQKEDNSDMDKILEFLKEDDDGIKLESNSPSPTDEQPTD